MILRYVWSPVSSREPVPNARGERHQHVVVHRDRLERQKVDQRADQRGAKRQRHVVFVARHKARRKPVRGTRRPQRRHTGERRRSEKSEWAQQRVVAVVRQAQAARPRTLVDERRRAVAAAQNRCCKLKNTTL